MNLHPKKLFPGVDNLELLNHQPITKRDLLNFSNVILSEIKEMVGQQEQPAQWLKSSEVRKLLKISPGTLQNLRINGTLNYKRIGGIIFYKYDDIKKMLEK
ncbi:helix-turn-helix domain-containing protein [Flavobacterium taihuense]|uniref:Helix-turn-helix domain-containing protein n=1 Tax=Flavobacterium taihuense TaxID=2857508 RepID=A0ABS6XU36_9FLAO|nr:helix-turn-helix domain-containing protein [Flavobacterium taihuense]MBW4359374.1 helix-turn-helix domain-containing protein [Flavobacterium taihuense]